MWKLIPEESTVAEIVWAFDEHMAAAQHAGRPVIGPNSEIVGGISYIGPDQPAITVACLIRMAV